MRMNATQKGNVQSTRDSTVIGEHPLARQQASVFDTLEPRPDIPWPQCNVGAVSHGTFRPLNTGEYGSDLGATLLLP